jgi:hypothetical protein
MSARISILTVCTTAALACTSVSVATTPADVPDDRARVRWGHVRTLAPNPWSASLAVDGRGTTTVAWSTSDFPARIVARQRFANGTWGKKAVLGDGSNPQVVADHRGVTTVVWISDGVVASRRTRATDWSAPTTLSRDVVPGSVVGGATDLDVAVNRGGAVVVAWTFEGEGVESRIQSAYRPRVGSWRKAVDVTPGNGAGGPEVGISADGTAMVVYGTQAFGEPQVLASRVRGTGGRWSSSSPVTAEGYSYDLAVAPDGRAVVVFTPDFSTVRAATRAAGGKWGTPRKLVTGGELNDVDVTAGRGKHFVVGITRGEGRVEVVERGARGGWSEPVRLADGGTVASDVMVAVNDAGDTYVGWGSYGVYGRYRPNGGPWSRRLTAQPDSGVDVLEWASAVVAPNGDVPVLWDQEELPLRMRVLLTP